MSVFKSVVECIGNTPLVRLNRISEGIEAAEILVKLEMQVYLQLTYLPAIVRRTPPPLLLSRNTL